MRAVDRAIDFQENLPETIFNGLRSSGIPHRSFPELRNLVQAVKLRRIRYPPAGESGGIFRGRKSFTIRASICTLVLSV